MPRKLPAGRPERTAFTISELNLHWIGILLLCLNSLGTAMIRRGILHLDAGMSLEEASQVLDWSSGAAEWAVQAAMLSMAASLAIPLYAKLLMEAVGQTENRRELLLTLGGCALISEVPYDWTMTGELVDAGMQNPAWGLLLGGIILMILQRQKPASKPMGIMSQGLVVFGAAAWALLLRVRMGVPLVLLCALFFFAYRAKREWIAMAGGAVLTLFYFPAPLGLLLVHWYDSRSRARCWVFCALYIAQLVAFGAMGAIMAGR